MDNFTALYTSYLRFTLLNSVCASTRAHGILVFFPAFFYRFMLFDFWVKDTTGVIDHAQTAYASLGLCEAYTCRSNSTPDCIICVCLLDFEKFNLVQFQSV